MEAAENLLSPKLKEIFLDLIEEKSLCDDFDTQSLSLSLFSMAHIGFSWEHSLSSLSRVSLRKCVIRCADNFSSKEFYWSTMGLAKMVKLFFTDSYYLFIHSYIN